MRVRLERSGDFDYQVARSNDEWPEHVLRTNITAGMIAWLKPGSVLDPACGDGSIVLAADHLRNIDYAKLSDVSEPSIKALTNTPHPVRWDVEVEDIWHGIHPWIDDPFDVVVLTEILEHVPDPVEILKSARMAGRLLVASSPSMRAGQVDSNPEHLWMFDQNGYREMLVEAGWEPGPHELLFFDSYYDFQIWVAK